MSFYLLLTETLCHPADNSDFRVDNWQLICSVEICESANLFMYVVNFNFKIYT